MHEGTNLSVREIEKQSQVFRSSSNHSSFSSSCYSSVKNSEQKATVFIVDDEERTREVLKSFYLKEGYKIEVFSNPMQALHAVSETEESPPDLVVCDFNNPEMNCSEFIEKVKDLESNPPVIVLTEPSSVEEVVEVAAKPGSECVSKPIDFNELSVVSERVIKIHRMEEDYKSTKREIARSSVFEEIVGKSPAMHQVFDAISRVSQVSCNVLITGESGTGKEMVARAIHSHGPRAKKPFIAVNCAAIPAELLESELFGHAKGSFTGATERRKGLLEEAHEGTFLLDEIGDLPLSLQAKLLRFVQDRKIKLVGENTYKTADIRIIAATHRNLKELVRNKKFREDLYYRLCVVPIEIPPLRERREDVLLLAEHFLNRFARKFDTRIIGFTKAAQAKLMSMRWPGNIRELENTIERAVVFCEETLIDEEHIQAPDISEAGPSFTDLFSRLMSLDQLEREYIEYVLVQTGGNKEKASEILGVNRKTLYRKQMEYKKSAGQ